MAAVDAPQEIVTLLASNWNTSNTNSKLPSISKLWSQAQQSILLATVDKAIIKVGETTSPYTPAGIGSQTYRHNPTIIIDIRSLAPESDALLILEETLRILNANKSAPGGSFEKLLPPFNVEMKNDKTRNLYRYVITFTPMTWRRTL